ncbi:hypothetical protein RUM44_013612 [Polyplax serrata]|uniref:TMEM248/TMEM219 domain-containing protein n=1 Tax=Polyplax serrata TaxID=468196 RepID=A0ABR1BIS0_POLSC
MGVSSPLHYVKGYSVGKPPVIIFVICLILCATATIGMGLFIQYSDTILNPEVKGMLEMELSLVL